MIPNYKLSDLKDWQVGPADYIYKRICVNLPTLLVAPTRSGKSFGIAAALKKAQDAGLLKTPGKPVNILVLTQKSIKIQFARVLKGFGIVNFLVESYAAMRSSLGEIGFIDWVTTIERGVTVIKPVWRAEDMPDIIILDEFQNLKNPNAQQTSIIEGFIEQGGLVVGCSATPYTVPGEGYIIALAGRLTSKGRWETDARELADVSNPWDINHEATKRFTENLEREGLLTKYEDIKYAHRTINRCRLIDFRTEQDRQLYYKAYEEYLRELEEAGREGPQGIIAKWVATLKFRQAAELLRAAQLAEAAIESIQKGEQVILFSNFVDTLRAVWHHLVKVKGIKADLIGFIIGSQNDKQRQQMIDDFQNGKILIILTTLKAGGVGISLHHDRPEGKPRRVILPPTWSGIELIQGLGRAHGPTSLSTTHQDVMWFKGTIEETDVVPRVEARMKCLKEAATKKETWADLFSRKNDEDLSGKIFGEQEEIDEESGVKVMFDIESLESELETTDSK
jgi:superfamily II DNA or RNA helicase